MSLCPHGRVGLCEDPPGLLLLEGQGSWSYEVMLRSKPEATPSLRLLLVQCEPYARM